MTDRDDAPSEPPVAAPDHAETIRRHLLSSHPNPPSWAQALNSLTALLAERQQDKERIDLADAALEIVRRRRARFADERAERWSDNNLLHPRSPEEIELDDAVAAYFAARARLAGEEDTAGTKSSEADSAAIAPTDGAAKPKEREEQRRALGGT